MSNPSFRQKMRYRFDNFMARGGRSIFISLMVTFLVLFVSIAIVRGIIFMFMGAANQERNVDFFGQLYIIWLAMTDPGNMNQDVTSATIYKIPAILAGLSGVIILSALIAFITTALNTKLSQLKKGHSKVIEEGHTLILGWNDRVIEILRELLIANESEGDACVVILAEKDKEAMDDFLNIHLKETKTTRIVTRSGSMSSLLNLDVVSVTASKSVIVLASCNDSGSEEEKMVSDTKVIKTILAVMASKESGQKLNIVVELFHDRSRRIAETISPDEVTTVDALEILAKILVQTSRSVGLSVVYGEALSFDGCELYFHNAAWGNITFGALQFHFPDGVPMGVKQEDGKLLINAPADYAMRPTDDVLILAEDNSTIEFRPQPVAQGRNLPLRDARQEQGIENELIIGWNAKAPIILREYSDYVLEGSSITIMMARPGQEIRDQIKQLQEELPKLRLSLVEKDPMRSETLIEMEPFKYNNIIILSQSGGLADSETTDSETIVILLLLRQIFEQPGRKPTGTTTKLITEVMDSENRELIARAGVNDFIISNAFVSMILAQVSEEPDIKRVYDDLFAEDGSEIYLKPVSLYFDAIPAEVTFADLMLIAQKRNEACIGVKIKARERDMKANFGVKLIPEKTTKYALKPEDCLIVVAEDET